MLALSRFPGIGLGLSRIAAVLGLLALLVTSNVHAWEVFMKSSPCAATLRDWITVAESNPTGRGGGNFYMPARGTGNVFPQSSAGFTAAHAGADAKRILGFLVSGESTMQEKYENYCCKDSTVWQRRMPDGSVNFSITGKFGNPGAGFEQVGAPMCCEQAAALAGTTAGCGTFQLSNGALVRFTSQGVVTVGGGTVAIGGLTVTPTGTFGPTISARSGMTSTPAFFSWSPISRRACWACMAYVYVRARGRFMVRSIGRRAVLRADQGGFSAAMKGRAHLRACVREWSPR